MSPLGLIVGSALLGAEPSPGPDLAVLQRHSDEYLPPHRIDHGANLRWLAERGCERVLAIASVGSLRAETAVGSFLCPDDFIALHLGGSSFGDERGHIVPGFDPGWRSRVQEAWGGVDNLANGIGGEALSGGTYDAGRTANRARLEGLVPTLVAELRAGALP